MELPIDYDSFPKEWIYWIEVDQVFDVHPIDSRLPILITKAVFAMKESLKVGS